MATPMALMSRAQTARYADWVVRILLALAFVSAGSMKLAGAPPMVAMFDQIGVVSGSACSPARWRSRAGCWCCSRAPPSGERCCSPA